MDSGLNVHAYLVAGGSEAVSSVRAFLESEGVVWERNPDIYLHEYVYFGVDDARALRARAETRAIHDARRVFIIVAPVLTHEAQNALLKTFEEPSARALFFLVTPAPHALLATLRSRATLFEGAAAPPASPLDPTTFLAAAPAARLDMMKPLYEHDEDDVRDLRPALAFFAALERALSTRAKDQSVRRALATLYRTRDFMTDKGALLKPLFEQVALLAPRL